jgi:hypothetical protein
VLPETDAEGAARTAERLGAVIRSSRFCEGTAHELPVTASVGVAVFPDHGVDASQLLRSADNALYDAKAAGRDCWRFASGEPVGDVPRPDPATSSEALLEAFDETSPIARSGDASSEHPSSEHPSSEQPSSGQEAPPTPKVVVMPDVHVATRGEPRRPES